MQPNYGCDLQPYLFDPLNSNLIGYLKNRVHYAIIFYESRINVINIDVSAGTSSLEGRFQITVTYSITQTNTRFNYVYDYFQNEALQPI
jgi:phage baseplate assembly protein W